MHLFKYRDLSDPRVDGLGQAVQILRQQAFWAARPDTLNDPEEFAWSCDYTPSHRTLLLLANVLHLTRRLSAADALLAAHHAIERRALQDFARPVIQQLQKRCRDEIGLICFGTSDNHSCLWQRYGGGGEGVCIELQAAEQLVGSQLHRVHYADQKHLHIDDVLAASLDTEAAGPVYTMALLAKPVGWHTEEEVRFVSKRQGVAVRLAASPITAITLGSRVPSDASRALLSVVSELPYPVAVRHAEA